MKLRSLQSRLQALVLSMVLLVWLTGAALVWRDAEHEIDELLDSHLSQAAELLLEHQRVLEREADLEDEDLGHELREHAPSHKYATKVAHQVFRGGSLVWRSAHLGEKPLTEKAHGFATVDHVDGARWRVFALSARESDVRVVVAEQMDMRRDILWAVMGNVLMPLVLALPLLMVGLWWAVGRGLLPLRALVDAVRQRRPMATEPLTVATDTSELDALVRALNDLFERMAHLVAGERRFTADAAHELRTPIAVIRAHTQVAQLAQTGSEREQALAATLAGCDRASHLVDQLLMLARLEATGGADSEPIELANVVQQVAADLAHLTLDKRQGLDLQAQPGVFLRAQGTLVAVLARNLIDNATRYSPPEARILVQVQALAGRAVLRVQDGGPGLTTEEIERLGQRFFRVLGQDQPGSGLGWSIVRRIAQVQGAEVLVGKSRDFGGLDVSVSWPLAPPQSMPDQKRPL